VTPGNPRYHVPVVRGALVRFFRRVVHIYFRRIEVAGNRPSEDTGGRVFVGNHANGLVDPVLVITSAACRISPVGKSTLWRIPGLKWLLDAAEAVPIERRQDQPDKSAGSNEAVFDRIADWLSEGGNILIFPEGTSHSEPQLITVKTGAARMLARAYERGARDVSFQSVALEFDARDHFRSRALVLYGPIRYASDFDATGEELVRTMTSALRDDLSELLVEGETWPERVMIARIAEMLTHESGERSLEKKNTIGRQVEAANKALRGRADFPLDELREAVDRYYALLEREGLEDAQLASGNDDLGARGLAKAVGLVAAAPLAAVGAVLYWVPYQLPRLVAKKTRDDPDKISTFKLATGLVVYPLWAGGLIAASSLLLPPPLSAGAALVIVASPFAALAWLDATPAMLRQLRLATRGKRIEELREARTLALDRIRAVRDRLGG
jgi:glycerol-3-phosphate O-acyltransferase / dihydroxyacetone phosphate acyltransferase